MKECSRKLSTDGATRQASGAACRSADGSVHGGCRPPRRSRTAPRACVVLVRVVRCCAQCICRVHRCISAMQCIASIMLELHDPTWSYSTPTDPRGSRVLKGARGSSKVHISCTLDPWKARKNDQAPSHVNYAQAHVNYADVPANFPPCTPATSPNI